MAADAPTARAPGGAPLSTGAPAIEIRELRQTFGAVEAVRGISIAVRRGEMFGLIGPDGAGKTTTLRAVLGLIAPTGGSITTCGLAPVRQRRALSRRVGYLAQRFSLYGDLTVDENIAFFAAVHGVRSFRPRRDELLDLLRMTPFRARLGDRLSGGMKQKLALACTLIHTPELLVLDEPTTGVDPVSRRDFWKILSRIQRDGLTILLTTPYLDEAERCHRVALMERGQLLSIDTPDALRRGSKTEVVEILAVPRRRAREVLATIAGVIAVQVFGERLHASLSAETVAAAPQAAVERLVGQLRAAGIEVESARLTEPTLEDVFIAAVTSRADQAGRVEEAS